MKAKISCLILAALILVGIAILRYRAQTHTLRIDPHAAGEIEKAKGR
jgi:hypothetical protein